MKSKKKFLKLVACVMGIIMSMTLFSGCVDENKSTEQAFDGDPFIVIKGEEENGLVYHKESRTVYVLFKEASGHRGYGYLAEYIVNGHNCEYKDGKIVEVIPENENIYEEKVATQTADERWNALTEEEKEALLSNQ